jgi:hypothetical protein
MSIQHATSSAISLEHKQHPSERHEKAAPLGISPFAAKA